MATRQPIKSIAKTPAAIATNAAAEKARKAASKRALHAAIKAADATPSQPVPAVPVEQPDALAARKAQERANAIAAWTEDAIALGHTSPEAIASYVAAQDAPVERPAGYTGPMLALRSAAKAYVTGKNGNPHCNDALAILLDGLTREQVVVVLIAAMKLPGNPYLNLNPGQQSMNLRNKARGQLKNGFIKPVDITSAIAAIRA